ncbi:translation initiation factor eIF-3b [Cantharellus anzutake]|uniref:translation initiation factor eIF-3b n=1 Tax=Cantharellus anzutake TaxID=1750568 RepID=UPI0019033B4E|nr:translation initiation factor eIF-3b [Cantharellus anzutake]KAF8337904.1 translation initiation factor eIF-3b [Cantharellus anzutake]
MTQPNGIHPPYENIDDPIDYSDIEAKYQVSFEEGFDAVVVIDNLPIVDPSRKDKLLQVINKHLKKCGSPKPDNVFMPWDDAKNQSKGYAFFEFSSGDEANICLSTVHGSHFDKSHQFLVNRFTDIEKFAALDETYVKPIIDEYKPKEHLRSWLADPQGRDQYVTYRDLAVTVFWYGKPNVSEVVLERDVWTELYCQWSPQGTYLTTIHRQGVQLWGGSSWSPITRVVHPFIKLVAFSPNENYLVTWSPEPITVGSVTGAGDKRQATQFTEDDEGNQIAVWDIKTGQLLRTFLPTSPRLAEEDPAANAGAEKRRQILWPALKWSGDDKYVARVTPGSQISVYELPGMGLVDKKSLKIEGVIDFEWAPIGEKDREVGEKQSSKTASKKPRENILAYWTPEMESQPARVSLMAFPSRTVLRVKNLINVFDAKFYWQSGGDFLCVRIDRHSKTKKTVFSSLEIFRVREKDFPVEIIETKSTVLDISWEPTSDRFVMISSTDPNLGTAPGSGITIRTDVGFYGPDKSKGDFKLFKNLTGKNTNIVRWSPRGRHVVLTTMGNSNHFALEFWDLDFTIDDKKLPADRDPGASIRLLSPPGAEHYGITDLEWDPSGRYVASSASVWRHSIENGFAIWDWRGVELEKHIIDKFKQFLWRPRPRSLLSKGRQEEILRNLASYSRVFDEEDAAEETSASKELVSQRKRLVDEWNAWRARVEAQREAEGIVVPVAPSAGTSEDKEEVQEWVEELIETIEEVLD